MSYIDNPGTSGGGSGTVTSVAGGVGITNVPDPIVGAGTVNLDIFSLVTETSLAAGDWFPFVDVSNGTGVADQRKVTLADLVAAINPLLDHGALLNLTAPADDHTQYFLLAGRAGGQMAAGGTAITDNLSFDPSSATNYTGTIRMGENAGNYTVSGATNALLLDLWPNGLSIDGFVTFLQAGSLGLGVVNLIGDGSSVTGVSFAPSIAGPVGTSAINSLTAFRSTMDFTNTTTTNQTIFSLLGLHIRPTVTAVSTGNVEVRDFVGLRFDAEFTSVDGSVNFEQVAAVRCINPTIVDIAGTTTAAAYVGLDSEDITLGALRATVRSAQSAAAGAWFLLGTGTASSSMVGGLRIGDNTAPAQLLEVAGNAVVEGSGLSINGRDYVWPALGPAGVLTNDGADNLTWVAASTGTVTSVAGGVGITNSPEPITTTGTVDLDINSLTSETTVAAGDLFAFVDVSVGTTPAAQRKATLTDITTGIAGLNVFQPLDADLTAYAALATTGIVVRTGAGTVTTRSLAVTDTTTIDFTLTNADGVAGNPTITASVLAGGIDHNSLANLTVGDPHTQYLILAGRAGGQIAHGGTAAGEDLELRSTAHATKGSIILNDFTELWPAMTVGSGATVNAAQWAPTFTLSGVATGRGWLMNPTVTCDSGVAFLTYIQAAGTHTQTTTTAGTVSFLSVVNSALASTSSTNGVGPWCPDTIVDAGIVTLVGDGTTGNIAATTAGTQYRYVSLLSIGTIAATLGASYTFNGAGAGYAAVAYNPKLQATADAGDLSILVVPFTAAVEDSGVGITETNGLVFLTNASTILTRDWSRSAAASVSCVRSLLDAATNKYCIRSEGTAQSVHTGPVRIGNTTNPTDKLEVFGGNANVLDGVVIAARTIDMDVTMTTDQYSFVHADLVVGASRTVTLAGNAAVIVVGEL